MLDLRPRPEAVRSDAPAPDAAPDVSRQSLRGSSLLLVGRLLSIGLNLVAQILVVRALSMRDYGAFAYALTTVAFFDGISSLGLARGISRFAPIYHERRDWERLFGTIALVVGTTLAVSTLVIATMHAAPHLLGRLVRDSSATVPLLLIMILLVPLEAADQTMAALFASFTKPKAIFFRKYVLAPGLKVAAVGLLIALHAPVTFLAWAYVVTSLFGVLLYGVMLVQFLRAQGWLEHLHPRSLRYPAREIFAFTIPLLTADLVYTAMLTASTFFLGYFHGETAVAQYRAVVPAARLNMLVMSVFQMLYTPQAARLFARNDMRGIDNLYWRTAVWIAVLSFPVFALTFSMAKPLTAALFGERYAGAWPLLQILSFGFYFSAATGFNGITLKVLGKLRYSVAINLAAMALCALLCVVWVPRFGALGAAIATTTALFVHNLLKQAGLRLVGGLRVFDAQCLSFYALIAGAAAGLVGLQMVALRSIWTAVPVAALVSLVVLWAARHRLRIDTTFPELARVPFVGRTLGVPRRRSDGAGGSSDAVRIVGEETP